MAKRDKKKLMAKIVVWILAGLMVFSVAATLIFSIIG